MQPQRLALLTFALLALVPPLQAQSLKGSRDSMQRQYQLAVSYGYTFLKTPASVNNFVSEGHLVKVSPSRTLALHDVSYPYARPEVKMFVERLSGQYLSACGEKLTVTSLTRPSSLQPANASEDSVHPTGMAVDLRVPGDAKCRRWLETTLLALEGTGVLDVTREYRPPHFHVAVYTKMYGNYVASLDSSEPAGSSDYVVQRGDTLSRIADRTGASVAALRSANALRNDLIQVGQKLSVPGQFSEPAPQVASISAAPIRANEEVTTSALPVQAVAAVAVRNAASTERGNDSYVVKRGDSLARIAERTGTTVAALRRDNGLRGNLIHPGQTLQIAGQVAVEPAAVRLAAATPAPPNTAFTGATAPASYVVRKGDSLATIAARTSLSVAQLRQLNGLDGSLIYPGQALRLVPEALAPSTTAALIATVPLPEETSPAATTDIALINDATNPTASTYVVNPGDALASIADRVGISVDDLRRLNALRGSLIHPGQTLRLAPEPAPEAAAAVLVATVPLPETLPEALSAAAPTVALASTVALAAPGESEYLVRRGDSLASIAARVGMTVDELRQINALRGTLIHPGQSLRLTPDPDIALAAAPVQLADTAAAPPAVAVITDYKVRKGDTLSTIATRTGTSIMTLRQANGLRNDLIRAGQTLAVPTLASLEPITDDATIALEHEVRRGESLWRIANRYGTTVSSLRQANDLPGDSLTVGQVLRVSVALTSN